MHSDYILDGDIGGGASISGYEGISGYIISGVTMVDIAYSPWESCNKYFGIYVDSGDGLYDPNIIEVNSAIYCPYYIYRDVTASSIEVKYPTWEIYCSGKLPEGLFDMVNVDNFSGLDESGARNMVFKYLGMLRVYMNAQQTKRFFTWTSNDWFGS